MTGFNFRASGSYPIIGVNGLGTNGHLWLVTALKKHGMTDKMTRRRHF